MCSSLALYDADNIRRVWRPPRRDQCTLQLIKAAFSAPLLAWQGGFIVEIIAIPPGSGTPCATRDCLAPAPGKRRYSGRLGNRSGEFGGVAVRWCRGA